MVSWDQSSQLLSLALGFISNLITFCQIKSDLKNGSKVYNEKEKTTGQFYLNKMESAHILNLAHRLRDYMHIGELG